MKKIAPDTDTTELITAEEIALAQVIPIRTETTLTRLPIHRIAKKGVVQIKQTKQNAKGKVITTWEVDNPPSSLAYKIDTIVINRRIDEMRTKGEIRQIFKLGSLRDICIELGINPSGNNTNSVREALHENGSAYIRAKLDYKGNDGIERTFEFGTTRYTVIFTGQKLPNDKRADAVYVELHPRFHEMLRHSKTRPLDYSYLKALPPAAQRLYELLSFAMFGSLTYGRPNAQMFYSEFCQSAPLTRHHEFFRVRSQMRKIHQPHIESGYLKAVEFEETADAEGKADWLIRYTPGRKAKHEFKEFTTKKDKQLNQAPPRPRLVKGEGREAIAPKPNDEDFELTARLIEAGVTESIAKELVESDREECQRQLEALAYRDRVKDKGGYIVKAIRDRYAMPSKMDDAKRKEQQAQEQEAKWKIIEIEQRRQQAEEDYFRFFEPDFRAFQSIELLRIEQEQPEAFKLFNTWFQKNHAKVLKMVEGESRREEIRIKKAAEFFAVISPELKVRLTNFEQWNSEHNKKACDPIDHHDRIFEALVKRMEAVR